MRKTIILILCSLFPLQSFATTKEEKLQNTPQITQADYESMLADITSEYLVRIQERANTTDSQNENNIKGFVLSTHIGEFSDIPDAVNEDIANIKNAIQLLVKKVATDIELSNGNSSAINVDQFGQLTYQRKSNLPSSLNAKRKKLLTAHMQNSVTVRSAAIAIRLLVSTNENLKQAALTAKSRKDKERLFITQAIFVYEVADIALKIIDSVKLNGKSVIHELHQEAKSKFDKRVIKITEKQEMAGALAKSGEMSVAQYNKEMESFNSILRANELNISMWERLMDSVNNQEEFLQAIFQKHKLITFKKEQAKLQLETLRDIRQTAELRDAIGNLDDIAASIASLDLLVLDEMTVRQLLGYNEEK